MIAAAGGEALKGVVSGRMTVLFGVPYTELPQLYGACDLLLCPSLYEGFGLTLIEAWACGLPVVTGRVGIVEELLGEEPAFDASVAGTGDAAGLASAIARMEAEPEFARRQAEWGRRITQDRFNLARFEEAYVELASRTVDQPITAQPAHAS